MNSSVKRISVRKAELETQSVEDVLGLFCYYFPSYKYNEARELPYIRIKRLLGIAIKERARQMLELTQIVAAPHTKKGEGVRKLVNHYKKVINA